MSRLDQVNELLRRELAGALSSRVRGENFLITITKIKCSPDLKSASAYVSVLPENKTGTALKILKKEGPELRNSLKKKVKLKFIPKILWKVDPVERSAVELENFMNNSDL